jgi:hypothetical protein
MTTSHRIPQPSNKDVLPVEELEAIPWANNGRDGVAYRATAIHQAAQSRAA